MVEAGESGYSAMLKIRMLLIFQRAENANSDNGGQLERI
jgi:hypothetical protein